jgi:hypothetical protein
MPIDTELTLKLLAELKAMGFPDAAFSTLHHYRLKGVDAKINEFADYITRPTRSFLDEGNNALVHRRLEIVRDAYRGGRFESGLAGVLVALAEDAYLEVPPIPR